VRPVIAIVGRPNVGKSSLFNRLVGQPVAIVDPTPGVTRDRLLHEVRRDDLRFNLIDTGGIGIVDEAKLEADVYKQVRRAIATADKIIFLTDGRDGVLPLDREIADSLRGMSGKVVLAVNKIDHDGLDGEVFQFAKLGMGEPLAISAAQAHGLHDLLERLAEGLPGIRASAEPDPVEDHRIKLCLAGRRNVGKSSLTNALCGEERVIVADLAGTTRDAIDVPIDHARGTFTLIDTAGLRKKAQIEEDVEFYAACRTERAICRADVILLVLDAGDELGMVDKKLAHFCESEGKPTVIVINKWDIAEAGGAKRAEYIEWLRDRLPGLRYAPVAFTCALTGANIDDILRLAVELQAESKERVPTAEVNKILELAIQRRRPRKNGPTHTKIYYCTQVEHTPPTFLFFVNRPDLLEPGYSRYLENFLRDHLPFRRIPLRLLFKPRDSRFADDEGQGERKAIRAKTRADRNVTLVLNAKAKARRRH
jgi:GTP-binding protein